MFWLELCRYSSDPFLSGRPRTVVVVVVVSHIQRIGCQPEKNTLHGGQSRSWSAEQGKKEKEKVWQRTPPPPRALLVRRKNENTGLVATYIVDAMRLGAWLG